MEKASATGSRKAKKPGNFEVIHALDQPQQKIALVDPKAYSDILTAASRKAVLQGQPRVRRGKMRGPPRRFCCRQLRERQKSFARPKKCPELLTGCMFCGISKTQSRSN